MPGGMAYENGCCRGRSKTTSAITSTPHPENLRTRGTGAECARRSLHMPGVERSASLRAARGLPHEKRREGKRRAADAGSAERVAHGVGAGGAQPRVAALAEPEQAQRIGRRAHLV